MKIEYNPKSLILTITDEERSRWRDGLELFYKIDKDDQPEWNPYEYFDDIAYQPINKLHELGLSFGINKTPKDVEEVIENAAKLAQIFDEYINHALAVCLDAKKQYEN